ncbi:hypothetical protein [Bradyrhizobium guangxiense]|uniref:hypothetical protein n=1 Tax=Bradyrhizobium guangxiense TaxID=1325115 RepID=UPI0013E8C51D
MRMIFAENRFARFRIMRSSIRLHEMLELRPLASDQDLGRSVLETRALQLPDGRPQFENLGASPQDSVSFRVLLHSAALEGFSAACSRARNCRLS